MKNLSRTLFALALVGCGNEDPTFIPLAPPANSPPAVAARPVSLRLGKHSPLLRSGAAQVLFPNITVSVPEGGTGTVVTITPDSSLVQVQDPGPGPKSVAVLDGATRTLTLTFTGASGEEISQYLRSNLKASAPVFTRNTTLRTANSYTNFAVQVQDSLSGNRARASQDSIPAGATLGPPAITNFATNPEQDSLFLFANSRARAFSVEPSGQVTDLDSAAIVSPSGGMQAAVDLVAATSAGGGNEAAGSLIQVMAGEYRIGDGASAVVRLPNDPDLDFVRLFGPNSQASGEPRTITGATPQPRVAPALLSASAAAGAAQSNHDFIQVSCYAANIAGFDFAIPADAVNGFPMRGVYCDSQAFSPYVGRCVFQGANLTTPLTPITVGCQMDTSGNFVDNSVQGCQFGWVGQRSSLFGNSFLRNKALGIAVSGLSGAQLSSEFTSGISGNIFQTDSSYSQSSSIGFPDPAGTVVVNNRVDLTGNDFYGQAVFIGSAQPARFVRLLGDNYAPVAGALLLSGLVPGNFTSLISNTTVPNFPQFIP